MISLEDALDAYVRVSCQPTRSGASENEQKRALRYIDLKPRSYTGVPRRGFIVKSIINDVEAATVTLTNVAKYARKLTGKVLVVVLAGFDMIGISGCLPRGELPAPQI